MKMETKTYFLLNLGCAKNLVEGEHIAGLLMAAGWEPVEDEAEASLLVVNTCGFIQPAVEESISAILGIADAKTQHQVLCVVGCLVGRYGKKLVRSMPEVDLFISPGQVAELLTHLDKPPQNRLAMSRPRPVFDPGSPRALTTGPGWAYLRVADGCGRKCHFCTIPSIRGALRSRDISGLVEEAKRLAQADMVELNLIAQDLTGYGSDLGMEDGLARLLAELSSVEDIEWIRMLYLHPEGIDRRIIQAVADNPKVLPYFDLPVQHIADPVLEAMGRRMGARDIERLITYIRERMPQATLRTSLIAGHPGEGEGEFARLMDFVVETRFDHLGCFAYEPEAGTKSARMEAPARRIALARQKKIMALQKKISREKLKELVGQTKDCLVLGPHPESDLLWQGRLASQAPEADGEVIITEGSAQPGTIARLKITRSHDYDVEGELL